MKTIQHILLFLILVFAVQSRAQNIKNLNLEIFISQNAQNYKSEIKKNIADSASALKEIRSLLKEYQNKGYLSCNADSIIHNTNFIKAYISTGKIFSWAKISYEPTVKNFLREAGVDPGKMEGKKTDIEKFNKTKEKIIRVLENNGFPFAQVKLDSIEIINENISGKFIIEKNKKFIIDSLVVKGNTKISENYLTRILGIKKNDPYNESLISQVSRKIKEMPFLNEVKPFEVEFSEDKTKIYLYLENKKANQFNGILGILPDNKIAGKILLTGEVNLSLMNSLKQGESIFFNWVKLEASSQELKAKTAFPFLLKSPIGADIDFTMIKKDSTYLSVAIKTGIQFLLKQNNFLKGFYDTRSSSLISTSGFASLTVLPAYADYRINMYGLGYRQEKLDYKFNPRNGFTININVGAGEKSILKNSKVNPELYENIKLRSVQAEGVLTAELYIPVSEKTTLKIGNLSGLIYNDNLFENELFLLGGLKTIRGFADNSIIASSYSVGILEYRFLFEQNSNAYIFTDFAYYEKNTVTQFVSDSPFGFGAGINFETKAGIFTLSYALGKQFSNPVELRNAKIHFGYIARF